MSSKQPKTQSSATMDSLTRAAQAGPDAPEHAQPPADGVEPWESGSAETHPQMPEGVEIIEAELVEPISPYTDRATELARREAKTGTDVATRSHPAYRVLDEALRRQEAPGGETDLIIGDILNQVLTAESIAEVLTPAEAVHLRDLLDKPFTLYGFKTARSEYEAGTPYYAVLDVTREDTGERVPVTTGAQQILAQLVRLLMLDAFPITVVAVRATKRPSSNGNWPMRLAFPQGTTPHSR